LTSFPVAFQKRSFDKDPEKAAGSRFDGETGESAPLDQLESHKEVVTQYHLHPEAKVHNGDHLNNGVTRRRHIVATAVEHIRKEEN
jgi:autonomous glycyl radical cofactor GrcA